MTMQLLQTDGFTEGRLVRTLRSGWLYSAGLKNHIQALLLLSWLLGTTSLYAQPFTLEQLNAQKVGVGTDQPKSFLNIPTKKTVVFGVDSAGGQGRPVVLSIDKWGSLSGNNVDFNYAGSRGFLRFQPKPTSVSQGPTYTQPVEPKMIWYGNKGAFRAGGVYTGYNVYESNGSVRLPYYPPTNTPYTIDNVATDYTSLAYFDNLSFNRFWDNDEFTNPKQTRIPGRDIIGDFSFASGANTRASGQYSTAMGYQTNANGHFSTALGYRSWATGDLSFVIGNNSLAGYSGTEPANSQFGRDDAIPKGNFAICIGSQSIASASNSLVFGNHSFATGQYSTAIGFGSATISPATLALVPNNGSIVSDDVFPIYTTPVDDENVWFATAIGYRVVAQAKYAMALGQKSQAIGEESTAMGYKAMSIGKQSIALGPNSVAEGLNAITLGNSVTAVGEYSTAMGYKTKAIGKTSLTSGDRTQALGENAVASGQLTQANGPNSTAMGYQTSASGGESVALGNSTLASVTNAVAMGLSTQALGNQAVSMGQSTTASGTNAFATGQLSQASAGNATAMGFQTKALANQAVSMGNSTTASAQNALATGFQTQALGQQAVTMGQSTTAFGTNSTAIGTLTRANGPNSMAMGTFTKTNAQNALALGQQSEANGQNSLASGLNSIAGGNNSVAMGSLVQANGLNSVALGSNVTASVDNTMAFGTLATASGLNALAFGNNVTADGTNSMAIGNKVSTDGHPGSVIIGDNSAFPYKSLEDQSMTMRFTGGYFLYTVQSNDQSQAIGAYLRRGANSWGVISDSTRKENFRRTDGRAFLQKISQMRLGSWNYKGQDAKLFRHYGPMAQDFFAAFGHDGVGTIGEDKMINQADFDGVNLIAIKALIEEVDQLKAELRAARQREQATQARLDKIEALLTNVPANQSVSLKP